MPKWQPLTHKGSIDAQSSTIRGHLSIADKALSKNVTNWYLDCIFCKTVTYPNANLSLIICRKKQLIIKMSICVTWSRVLSPEGPGYEHENQIKDFSFPMMF